MSSISSIRVRRIYVEPLTENDLKSGMTDAASAVFTIQGKDYQIPKSGGTITFASPLSSQDLAKTKVKLYMYDRQPSDGAFFTVSMPSTPQVVKGQIDLVFIQSSQPIVFNLTDSEGFRTFLNKTHTEQEMHQYVPMWCEMLSNKKELLQGFDD